MHFFSAIIDRSRCCHGSLMDCLFWAEVEMKRDPRAIAKILKARPDEKNGRIIFEVSADGFRPISHGRQMKLNHIRSRQPKPAEPNL